jgi:hypothetical protein
VVPLQTARKLGIDQDRHQRQRRRESRSCHPLGGPPARSAWDGGRRARACKQVHATDTLCIGGGMGIATGDRARVSGCSNARSGRTRSDDRRAPVRLGWRCELVQVSAKQQRRVPRLVSPPAQRTRRVRVGTFKEAHPASAGRRSFSYRSRSSTSTPHRNECGPSWHTAQLLLAFACVLHRRSLLRAVLVMGRGGGTCRWPRTVGVGCFSLSRFVVAKWHLGAFEPKDGCLLLQLGSLLAAYLECRARASRSQALRFSGHYVEHQADLHEPSPLHVSSLRRCTGGSACWRSSV